MNELDHIHYLLEMLRLVHLNEDADIDGWDIAVRSHRATDTSYSAFYDTIPRPDGRLALVVGGALSGYQRTTLYMSHVRSVLQVLMRLGMEPDTALAATNEFVMRNRPDGCTHLCVFLALVEPSTGSIVFASADAGPAMRLTTSGELRTLSATGPVLGLLPEAKYGVSDPIQLSAGDVLLVGTTEMDKDWGGKANIAASLRRHAPRCSDAASVLAGVLADFDAYRPAGPLGEFVAMVVRASE